MSEPVQHEIEVILMKQVASYLATAIFVVDPKGDLIYFNEPAEQLLGHRYDETGEMPLEQWSTMFRPRSTEGKPLSAQETPLGIALNERVPSFGEAEITGLDGADHLISITALPLVGQHDRYLGAVAIFWES